MVHNNVTAAKRIMDSVYQYLLIKWLLQVKQPELFSLHYVSKKYYTMYTKPVGTICRNHGLNHHFYADDSQLYLSFKPTDCVKVSDALRRVEGCLNDIVSWMHRYMLKLNADKTEVILFSSKEVQPFYHQTVQEI